DDVVAALGYGPPAEDARPDRRAILDRLAAKEISVEDALRLLRS
ncbi:MAG: Fis family transcriptional regulator, partial [Roseiflexus castenholzii]